MVERNNENSNQKIDDKNKDPTEEAFFSGMMDMEEEIASDAYDLIEHAINLIDSQFYDDSIEIMRQAIGLYAQINREEEIKAVNEKISEVYLLKEKTFREVEIEPKKKEEEFKVEEVGEDDLNRAKQLIKKAKDLEEKKEFEVALEVYDEVENIFEQLDKPDEIEKLYTYIEDCYTKKAEFLRTLKEELPESEASETEDELKDVKLKQFLDDKKREEEVASQAYKKIAQAAGYVERHEYKQALKLYEEGSNLFKKINWTYEIQKIDDTIIELEKEKVAYFRNLEEQKIDEKQKIEIQMQQEEIIEHQAKEKEEQEKAAKMERIKEIEIQKMEEDFFKAQIGNMAAEASKIVRDYELAMQKGLKVGKLVEKCEYPQAIEIYKKIRKLLIEKGWNSEVVIYNNTIDIYIQKLEQDKKIRQIEVDKVKKQKETKEMLKNNKEELELSIKDNQLITLDEEQRQREMEFQNFKNNLDEMTKRAERLAREYEVALRQGRFELKCPYPEIVKIYENNRQRVLERRMNTEVTIYTSQINVYIEKLEKDKRLRQIRVEKANKQKEAKELLKAEKKDEHIVLNIEELKEIETRKKKIQEEEEFHSLIDDMVNKAENLAREYDAAMKKAIKLRKLANNPPFSEIIEIYEKVREIANAKGREDDIAIYISQIVAYKKRSEKDNKLRKIEVLKAQRKKEIEDMHKFVKVGKTDTQRLKTLERKKKQEEFGKYISGIVDKSEKLARDFEIAMRKTYRKGEIIEKTPYLEIIENYKQIHKEILAKGWKEQAEIYSNQIKIYQGKLKKHKKLIEVEAEKTQRQKEIENMHKIKKDLKPEKAKEIEHAYKKKDEESEEFGKYITGIVDKDKILARKLKIARRKEYKKSKIIEK